MLFKNKVRVCIFCSFYGLMKSLQQTLRQCVKLQCAIKSCRLLVVVLVVRVWEKTTLAKQCSQSLSRTLQTLILAKNQNTVRRVERDKNHLASAGGQTSS
jgi:hypothetical protein